MAYQSIALALLVATAASVQAQPAAQAESAEPFYKPFGYDLTAIDPKTRPGDDFFQ
ncbi:MAG: hypothetical protein ABI626_05740 [Sphingomicrobium sp.]